MDALSLPQVTVDNTAMRFTVLLPGFGFSDLDRAGHVALWTMAMKGTAGRMTSYDPEHPSKPQHSLDVLQVLMKENSCFLVGCGYEITSDFYDKTHHYKPIVYNDQIANVGKSSYMHIFEGVSSYTHKTLFRGAISVVAVDKESKKPTQFIPWVKEQFSKTPKVKVPRVSKLEVPSKHQEVFYTAQPSDTDFYGHVNHTRYLMFCHNAASVLATQDKLSLLNRDLAKQHVRKFSGLYLSETYPGDVVGIRVWESAENVATLHFDIFNMRTEKSAFQGTMSFEASEKCRL